jgi:hypothetical protein
MAQNLKDEPFVEKLDEWNPSPNETSKVESARKSISEPMNLLDRLSKDPAPAAARPRDALSKADLL